MKIRTALFAMTALALVPGCSKGGANNAATANAPAPAIEANEPEAAPPANEAAATPAAGTLDRAFLIGRWGVNGDCSQVMEFAEDGTASPPAGSHWSIAGDQVTVTNPGSAPDTKTVARTGDDAMTVSGGGAALSMTRCPAA
jgi:hypothetical protein